MMNTARAIFIARAIERGIEMPKINNTVTIPLEEYKDLLLKEKPSDHDKEVLNRMFDIIASNLVYTESDFYSYVVMKNVKINEAEKVIKEIFTMLKYLDIERYMSIWNKVMTNERERKAKEELAKQMNDAKEIRNDC